MLSPRVHASNTSEYDCEAHHLHTDRRRTCTQILDSNPEPPPH